jgi:hypothetical protein
VQTAVGVIGVVVVVSNHLKGDGVVGIPRDVHFFVFLTVIKAMENVITLITINYIGHVSFNEG